MEEFLPSEIARAVYGYLLLEGCEDAANSFLETSPSLVECKQRVKHGKRLTHANTLLLGKSLAEVLNIACSVHSIVKQIHDKQQKGVATDGHESLTELLDQLRSCVFSDTRVEENSCSQPSSQLDPQCLLSSPHCLRTPPTVAVSLAENYRSLVQECSEGLDLSLSPEKTLQKNKNVESPSRQLLNRPTSAPGALGLSQLEMDNESAVAAITGIGVPVAASVASSAAQVVTISSSLLPTTAASSTPLSCAVSSVVASSTVVMATAVSTVTTASHQTSSHLLPGTIQNNRPVSVDGLPDPPIIVLNSQNQSCEGGDMSAAYFSVPPCAASTPQPGPAFMPEDTAFILYPPLTTDPKPKKVTVKEKTNLRRSGRLRKLLPKPARKDPPHIVHIKVLPQIIDEDNEEDTDEANEMELAKELSNSEEKLMPEDECERYSVKEGEIEMEKNMEVVATTSDKENVSDENILKGESVEKSNNNLATECDIETNTPRPPPLRKNISRSTPRRNSHVRALSFNTPLKTVITRKSNTSPKMPKIKFSPRSTKLSCVKRSSLFSPKNDKELSHLSEEEDTVTNHVDEDQEEIHKERNQTILENSPLYKVPIATRSPAPRLSSAWQEVNDIKITEKPVWDEQIRSFALGDFEDPAPPPKKGPQDKHSNLDMSPDNINKNSPKKANNQSLRSDVQNSCPRKTSRLKKASYTPVKSRIINKKGDNIEPLETSQKKKTFVKSFRSKTANKKKKSSLKKTNHKQSVLNSKKNSTSSITELDANQESRQLIKGPQLNAEDKNEIVIEVPTNVKHQAEETKEIQDNNILLEDLVVSSNSCFPQTSDEIRIENNNVKESSSQIYDGNENEAILHSNVTDKINKTTSTNNSTPTFVQPNVLVLETPSKEFQVCDQKTFALTTPLAKSIRKDISVLEEDLLLTPSLPPTPQVNSSPRNLTETPCKTLIGSPNINKAQTLPVVLKENESKFSQNKVKLSPSREKVDLRSFKEKDNMLSNSSESEIEGYKDVQNSLSTIQTHPMTENKIIHRSIQSIGRPSLTTTTDTSEDENDSHANGSDNSLTKSKITFNEKNKKNNMLNITRNRIYSTTESSDDETNSTKVLTNSGPTKSKLSKLASVLLENERKSLNQESRKTEANKKSKLSLKKQTQHSPESVSSVNSTQDKSKSSKKKDTKQSVTGSKQSKAAKVKSPKINVDNKEAAEKQTTPENMRQQLQSDLIKRERKMIFGDGFPSTSDSESDIDIFEKKKNLATKTKLKKGLQKKKTFDHIVLSEDSSIDNLNKHCLTSDKRVRFNTLPGISSGSPNMKQDQLLRSNPKISPIKSAEEIKCQENNVNNPSSLSYSSGPLGNLGQDKTIGMENNVSQAIIHEGNSKQDGKSIILMKLPHESRLNGQCVSTNDCNVLDEGKNNQSDKTSADERLKQSHMLPGPESNLCFKNTIPNICSMDRQTRQTVTEADDLLNETCFAETNLNNTTDSVQVKDIEDETKISMENSNSLRLENNNPRSPTGRIDSQNKSDEIEEKCTQKDGSKGENEICITSTSTYKNMNTTSVLNQLDLDRRDTFQVDEGNVVLSYSQIIKHHYYSPILSGDFVQSLNTESIQPTFVHKNGDADKIFICKEQAVKKRIKLIPIEDDKYEQKLQVDYDFIDDDNFIVNRGNRRLSEIDILDCSTSSILSSDTGCVKKQSLNFIRNPRDSHERKQEIINKNKESNLDAVKNSKKEENAGINEINVKLKSSKKKESKSNQTEQIQEKLLDDANKYKKYGGVKEIRRETINESRSRNQRSHHSRHQNEREILFGGGRKTSRHKNELSSPPGRKRERDNDSRYDRSYYRRDYRRKHSERWRRESDRRGFSERRTYSSHNCFGRSSLPDPQTSRHDPKRHFKTCVTDHDAKNIEQLKESLSKIEKIDLDRVDKLEKSTIGRFINQDMVDPRAAQVLTYSDVERNDSSRDEADSLMDFAVISKTKDKSRTPEGPSGSSLSGRQDPSNSSKRKAPNDIEDSPEACHVEKKLKLGEVEMKEAKSVLKHKMADMLNVLHPDTSNEAT